MTGLGGIMLLKCNSANAADGIDKIVHIFTAGGFPLYEQLFSNTFSSKIG